MKEMFGEIYKPLTFGLMANLVNLKITSKWKRWGTPQNFFLVIIDELEKQIFMKNCWSGPIKKRNFNIYNVAFLFEK